MESGILYIAVVIFLMAEFLPDIFTEKTYDKLSEYEKSRAMVYYKEIVFDPFNDSQYQSSFDEESENLLRGDTPEKRNTLLLYWQQSLDYQHGGKIIFESIYGGYNG